MRIIVVAAYVLLFTNKKLRFIDPGKGKHVRSLHKSKKFPKFKILPRVWQKWEKS